ncbi:hypothetical protein, partial [Capnocytophaga granulosa]|uniref:hypothetical protein n=1 Tax=Capnocytophaga granulosa TaxID=45242 RepID=UPI003C738E71
MLIEKNGKNISKNSFILALIFSLFAFLKPKRLKSIFKERNVLKIAKKTFSPIVEKSSCSDKFYVPLARRE